MPITPGIGASIASASTRITSSSIARQQDVPIRVVIGSRTRRRAGLSLAIQYRPAIARLAALAEHREQKVVQRRLGDEELARLGVRLVRIPELDRVQTHHAIVAARERSDSLFSASSAGLVPRERRGHPRPRRRWPPRRGASSRRIGWLRPS